MVLLAAVLSVSTPRLVVEAAERKRGRIANHVTFLGLGIRMEHRMYQKHTELGEAAGVRHEIESPHNSR